MAETKIVEMKKTEKNENVAVFSKEYDFEGKKYKEVDLSGLENMTAEDLHQANKVFVSEGNIATVPEITLEYAFILAASATHLPLEFFQQLGARDALKVKNRVTNFLYGED